MCGIAGIAGLRNAPVDPRAVRAMVDTIRHRGPDDDTVHVVDRVAMGMTRLSIIDIAGGKQPVFNEDGSIRAVFNGEIYNYRELRSRLRDRGHSFKSESDTEVIVHAYEEYGRDFPNHLNGMFAIALHDVRNESLLLVRDPVGVKPLYVGETNDHVLWGSEVKTLLAAKLLEKELDVDALCSFLCWEYVPAPATLLSSVRKLEPGHVLEIDLNTGAKRSDSYFDLTTLSASKEWTDQDWEDRLDWQVRESTRKHMVSDVPLGAFLSGGVDSSLITANMGDAAAFSIGFEEDSYNELPCAKKVADHLGLDLTSQIIRADAADMFWDLMLYMDDPIGDFSIFPTYLVSRLARQHVKVVLSGDGADEIFGGYETYVANNLAGYYARVPRFLRENVIEAGLSRVRPQEAKKGFVNKAKRFVDGTKALDLLGHARWRLFSNEAQISELLNDDVLDGRTEGLDHHILKHSSSVAGMTPVNRMLYLDFKTYLPDNILTKVDRMSMAVSLEARVPYLDVDMVNLAFSLPDHLKVNRTRTKVLLKRVAAGHVPRECVYRPKEGFSIPIKNWLRTRFRPLMEEFLGSDGLRNDSILTAATVSRLKREHLAGSANHSHILWSLIVFQAWRSRWLENGS